MFCKVIFILAIIEKDHVKDSSDPVQFKHIAQTEIVNKTHQM